MKLFPHTTFRTSYDGPEFDPENPDDAIYSEYIEFRHVKTGEVEGSREGTGRRYEYDFELGELKEYLA